MACDEPNTETANSFGYDIISPVVNPFHPEEERYVQMTYEIGDFYEIGDYMIGGPTYAIAGPQQARMPAGMMNPGLRQIPQQPAFVMQMPQPTIVRKKDPTESRLQPVGCNVETDIAVAATGTAIVRPQKIYKPERFTVPPTVAPDFLIDGIFVGVYLQSPSNTAIPAESFLPDSIYSNVDFDTCQISQELSVRARNRGGAPRPFFSTFYGRVLQ